ncbi:MAG TPA: hypothetical protein VNM16_09455 [Bacillota bacterium]|nr:hypothetical protein [Bacillota bacterium]
MAQRRVSFGAALLGGVVAGVVAALGVIGAVALLGSRAPSPAIGGASAFAAGIIGGILYGIFGGTRRPAAWLWACMLVLATLWSVLVARVHAAVPGGPNVPYIVGIMQPLRQLEGLLGLVKLGPRGYPPALVRVFIVTHYVGALLVALVVPAVAPARSRRRRPAHAARLG